jgi:hypothetical protein
MAHLEGSQWRDPRLWLFHLNEWLLLMVLRQVMLAWFNTHLRAVLNHAIVLSIRLLISDVTGQGVGELDLGGAVATFGPSVIETLIFLVSLGMIVQMALRDEGGTAPRLAADVGSEASVRSDVSFEVAFLVKALPAVAIWTHKWLHAALNLIYLRSTYMCPLMDKKALLDRVGLRARLALVDPVHRVRLLVIG